jgi:tetratricopeptide (TPR) repeat protein
MPKSHDRHSHEPAKSAGAPPPAVDRAVVARLIEEIPVIAAAVRTARDREGMLVALAPITQTGAAEQTAFATALGNQRGADAVAAADIAEALAELGSDKTAAKEARRAVIRLRSAGTRPTITVPRPALAHEPPPVAAAPEFLQGWASRTREKSEVTLALAWTRPNQPQEIDGFVLELNLWEGVVEEARRVEAASQRRFEREVLQPLRDEGKFTWVPVSLPQVRALIEATLDQGEWHKATQPAAWNDISRVLLRRIQRDDVEPDSSVERLLIDPDAEAEETLVNFWGSWSFGDYGLAYDLLSDRHALREQQTRADFIALRRQWHDEAQPARIQIGAIAPQTSEQGGIWLPGTANASGNRQNFALFWSLEFQESPLAGQIPEMPMATMTNPDTLRHWFWVGVTMERDAIRGGWKLGRIRDEALAVQAQPVEELVQRADALWAEADAGARSIPQNDQATQEDALKVIALAQESLSRGECALMRLLADRVLYEHLHDRAVEIGQWDRAAAITHRMLARFPDKPKFARDLATLDFRKAQTFAEAGDEVNYHRWLDLALAAARQAVELDRSAETLTLLAEMLMARNETEEAEQLLRESLELQETVSAWADLGDVLMSRQEYNEAISAFENAQRLEPQAPQIRWRLGRALEMVDRQPEARLVYEDALAANPQDAMAHALLGNVLTTQEDYDAARQHLEQALRLGLVSSEIIIQLAYVCTRQGNFAEARALLEQAKRINPTLTQQIDRLLAQVRAEEEAARRPKR